MALVAWAGLMYALVAFMDQSDLPYAFNVAPVPWLGFVALPGFVGAWRAGGRRRRSAQALLFAAIAAAAATAAFEMVARSFCESCSPLTWWQLLMLPLLLVWLVLGRLALALPLLVAWPSRWRALALALFIVGSGLALVPPPALVRLDPLWPWLLATVATLAMLGAAYLPTAWAAARKADSDFA